MLPVHSKRKRDLEMTVMVILYSSNPCLKFLTFALLSLLFISNLQTSIAATPIAKTTNCKSSKTIYKNYLKTACNTTTYPKLCYNSLFPYTSTIKTNDVTLCNTALTITLGVAKNTSALVKTLSRQKRLSKSETAVVKDCIDQLSDSIDELRQAQKALNNLKGSTNAEFVIADIKTYLSAAMTDEYTCTDGFDGIKANVILTSKIRKNVYNFSRFTSNALALVSKLNY